MTAQTKRTLYRLLALFLAAGAGDAIVQFVTADHYDTRHLFGVLIAAAVMAGEKFLSEQDSSVAAPTVVAVNAALETNAPVTSPKIAVPSDPVATPPPH